MATYQSSRRPFNQNKREINAFTASGGTEYKDLPPINSQGRIWQPNVYNSTGNPRANANLQLDRYQNLSLRNRNSEEGVGVPQFLSTHKNSDGQYRNQNRGRYFPHSRTARFQSPTMNQNNRFDSQRNQNKSEDRRNDYRDQYEYRQENQAYGD